MAHLYDWYFQQTVQENELDAAFEALQTAERNLFIDAGIAATDVDSDRGGILKGLSVSSPAGLNVDVAIGVAYDHQGRRVAVPTQLTVDLSKTGTTAVGAGGTPTGGVTTDPGAGNKRWVSLFIVFDRELTDSRVDGLGSPVFFSRAESFRFTVAQGAAAPVPTDTAPLETGKLLLGDFRITDGGVIDLISLDRRQVWARGADAAVPTTRVGSGYPVRGMQVDTGIRDSVLYLLGIYNDHVRNDGLGGDRHHANYVTVNPFTGTYGLSIADTAAQGFINSLSTFLDEHVAGISLAHADSDVTAALIAGSPNSLTGGSARSQMTELLGYVNAALSVTYAGGNNWADGTTNPGPVTYEAQFDKIIDDLTSIVGGRGAAKLTSAPTGQWHDASTVAAGTLHQVLNEIINKLGSTFNGEGSSLVGSYSYATPTPSSDSGLLSGSVYDQIATLADQVAGRGVLSGVANTWTFNNTFSGTTTLSGTTFLSGASTTLSSNMEISASNYMRMLGNGGITTAGAISDNTILKGWVHFTGTGVAGAQTVSAGYNYTSVSMAAGGTITLTPSIDMSIANYAVVVSASIRCTVSVTATATNSVTLVVNDVDAGTQLTAANLTGDDFFVLLMGRQY